MNTMQSEIARTIDQHRYGRPMVPAKVAARIPRPLTPQERERVLAQKAKANA
jgi:hypothetical protein